jgi:hypothetical protein
MKKLIAVLMSAVLALAVFTTGCVSPGKGGTSGTNAVPVLTGQQLTNAASLLRTTVRSAMLIVIDKEGTNATSYIALSRDTLSLFLGGTDYSPTALQTDLQKLPVKGLKTVEVQLAISTIIGAYQIYYQDYVAGQIGGNQYAVLLLSAVRDGLADALTMVNAMVDTTKVRLALAPVTEPQSSPGG